MVDERVAAEGALDLEIEGLRERLLAAERCVYR